MNIDVKSFLKNERNSVLREKLVNYRFFYEVKLSSARIGNDIQISFPEIDKEGYDIVLDDGERLKVFQLKTKLKQSKTTLWKVQKQLLRPKYENLALLGFESTGQNIGFEGGIILIEIDADEKSINKFSYYYCDIFILKAIELGLIPAKSKSQLIAVSKTIQNLKSDGRFNRHEKISIPFSGFVKAKDVDSLLSLSDLLTIKEDYRFWRGSFQLCLEENNLSFTGSAANSVKYLIAD
jgi:hypothetical protein